MKVLLVEPDYNARFAPFGLMKISSMLKDSGDKVKFVKGRKKLGDGYDVIYITTMFTYDSEITIKTILFYKKNYPNSEIKVGGIFASIMPEYIEKYTGIKPHIGLLQEAENFCADYDIIKEYYPVIVGYNDRDTSLAFTSRGCPRKCKFCVVPKIEGDLTVVKDWEKNIDLSKPAISFMDNNWLAKPEQDWIDDIKKIRSLLKKGIKWIDFNQALDCRLFTREHAKEMKGLPLQPVRFAFDGKQEEGYIQEAIRISREYGFMHAPQNNRDWNSKLSNSSIYVLYNFKDDPKYFYYRVREICKNGASAMPLRYNPIDSVRKRYIGKNWSKDLLRNLESIIVILFNKYRLIIPESKDEFELALGRDEDEFMELISDNNAKEIATRKNKRRQLSHINLKMKALIN